MEGVGSLILLGIITFINLAVLALMVVQVRDLTAEVHHTKKDISVVANKEGVHHDELEVGIAHLYDKLEQVGATYIDLSNKYTLLKRDVVVLTKKSIWERNENTERAN